MAFGRGGNQGGNQGGYQGGGRGRGRGRGQGGGHVGHQNHNGLAGLAVKQWTNSKIHPDQALNQLLAWLSKTAGGAKIETHELVGQRQNVLLIWVAENDKDNFLRLNNRNWAGVKLTIETSTRPPPNTANGGQSNTQYNNQNYSDHNTRNGPRNPLFSPVVEANVIAAIRGFYDEQNKHLNLTKFVEHELFQNLPEIAGKGPNEIWNEIFTLCKTKIWPDNHQRNISVPSITLKQNSITSAGEIQTLARIFPRIRNLDLSENMIQDLSALEAFQFEFRSLEHIILDGNPVNNRPDLLSMMRQWYPRLKNFNNNPVDGSVPMIQNTSNMTAPSPVPGAGTAMGMGMGAGLGQATFPVDTNQLVINQPTIPVAPHRHFHPEIPLDSLFAMETPGKSAILLAAEQLGLQVSLKTRLNMAATEELLKVTNFNYDEAILEFERVKALGQLTPDKFF